MSQQQLPTHICDRCRLAVTPEYIMHHLQNCLNHCCRPASASTTAGGRNCLILRLYSLTDVNGGNSHNSAQKQFRRVVSNPLVKEERRSSSSSSDDSSSDSSTSKKQKDKKNNQQQKPQSQQTQQQLPVGQSNDDRCSLYVFANSSTRAGTLDAYIRQVFYSEGDNNDSNSGATTIRSSVFRPRLYDRRVLARSPFLVSKLNEQPMLEQLGLRKTHDVAIHVAACFGLEQTVVIEVAGEVPNAEVRDSTGMKVLLEPFGRAAAATTTSSSSKSTSTSSASRRRRGRQEEEEEQESSASSSSSSSSSGEEEEDESDDDEDDQPHDENSAASSSSGRIDDDDDEAEEVPLKATKAERENSRSSSLSTSASSSNNSQQQQLNGDESNSSGNKNKYEPPSLMVTVIDTAGKRVVPHPFCLNGQWRLKTVEEVAQQALRQLSSVVNKNKKANGGGDDVVFVIDAAFAGPASDRLFPSDIVQDVVLDSEDVTVRFKVQEQQQQQPKTPVAQHSKAANSTTATKVVTTGGDSSASSSLSDVLGATVAANAASPLVSTSKQQQQQHHQLSSTVSKPELQQQPQPQQQFNQQVQPTANVYFTMLQHQFGLHNNGNAGGDNMFFCVFQNSVVPMMMATPATMPQQQQQSQNQLPFFFMQMANATPYQQQQ